jgi:hypothetical protein
MASLALTGKQGSPIKWSSQRSCMRACHHEMLVSRLRCGADRRTLAAGAFALRVPAARSAICCGVGQLLTPPRPISRRTLDAALLTGGTARPLRGEVRLHIGGYFTGCSCLRYRSLPLSLLKERSDSLQKWQNTNERVRLPQVSNVDAHLVWFSWQPGDNRCPEPAELPLCSSSGQWPS